MRQAIELVKSLQYKLRMFGIPVDGPADEFCDNELVFKTVSNPTSVLSRSSTASHIIPAEKLWPLV
jgi:hypothetical protein